MEQVEMQLSEFTLRSRSVAFGHRSTDLARGLEPGETIVVRDPATDHSYAAVVADVDFELADTVYRLEIGSRLAPEEVADWLEPGDDEIDEMSTRHVMRLLGELRLSRQQLRDLVDSY